MRLDKERTGGATQVGKLEIKYRINRKLKGVDGQAVVAHLRGLEKRSSLTAENVVADAKKKSSPLHGLFCWDDTEAARLYREEQARWLIRQVIQITIRGDEYRDIESRAFVNVIVADERQYVSMNTAMTTPSLRNQMLENALREMGVFERKYRDLIELSEVFAAIQAVRESEPVPA